MHFHPFHNVDVVVCHFGHYTQTISHNCLSLLLVLFINWNYNISAIFQLKINIISCVKKLRQFFRRNAHWFNNYYYFVKPLCYVLCIYLFGVYICNLSTSHRCLVIKKKKKKKNNEEKSEIAQLNELFLGIFKTYKMGYLILIKNEMIKKPLQLISDSMHHNKLRIYASFKHVMNCNTTGAKIILITHLYCFIVVIVIHRFYFFLSCLL